MQVDVGSVLNLWGQKWLVTFIIRHTLKGVCLDHNTHYAVFQPAPETRYVRYLSKPEIEEIELGDTYERSFECIELGDLETMGSYARRELYTHYTVKKVRKDGKSSSSNQTASSPSEGSRGGSEDRGRVGGPPSGEAGNALHGDGQVGEGRDSNHPTSSQGCEHTSSELGDNSSDRAGREGTEVA